MHCTTWLETTALLTAKKSTVSGYGDLLKRHVLPSLGHRRLLDLRPSDVDFVVSLALKKGLSVSTAKQVRRVLSIALAAADRDGLIPYNPVSKTKPPRAAVGTKTRKQVPYSDQEVKDLLKSLEGHPLQALFTLMACTGLRRGEALGLRWDDIDFGDHGWCVRVRRQVKEIRLAAADGSSTVTLEECAPKTSAGVRAVLIEQPV